MITYPEIRNVMHGCWISYCGTLLVGVIACFLFFIRILDSLYIIKKCRLVPLLEGPLQGSCSMCLQRILRVLVFELRATHRRIAHMCSLLFAHHQLSSAEQINHESTCRPGVAEQHLLCWSSMLLKVHLTVAFVCLKSDTFFIVYIWAVSSSGQPKASLRAYTR